MAKEICIIDYQAGNTFSIQNSFEKVGVKTYLSSDPKLIKSAEKVCFPGVGNFAAATNSLKEQGLLDVLKDKALSGTPFLAVCVGMQVLFEASEEVLLAKNDSSGKNSLVEGLGVLKGKITKFSGNEFESVEALKVPHMGWNQIKFSKEDPLLKGIPSDSDFYFVHSYKLNFDESDIASNKENFSGLNYCLSTYGQDFISYVSNGKGLFTCQFHPEKSGKYGLKLLENFSNL